MSHRSIRIRPRGLMARLAERALGRGQVLIAGGQRLPLIVASYPRGKRRFAAALSEALRFTLPALPAALKNPYLEMFARLPPVIVAELRANNDCTCLGHHHPRWALEVSRELAAASGRPVGEIDLAVEAIRTWQPTPLASLAVPPADREEKTRFEEVRFHTALLSVFLHELEHLAFPDRPEAEIRRRSDRFYRDSIRQYFAGELGASFGFTPEPAA